MVVDTATVAELVMHAITAVRDNPAAPNLRPWPDDAPAARPDMPWQRS